LSYPQKHAARSIANQSNVWFNHHIEISNGDIPMKTYRELLNLKILIATYPTKAEAFKAARKLSTASVFYSDGSYRTEGWEVWQ
jgi:hypothetical protein